MKTYLLFWGNVAISACQVAGNWRELPRYQFRRKRGGTNGLGHINVISINRHRISINVLIMFRAHMVIPSFLSSFDICCYMVEYLRIFVKLMWKDVQGLVL